MPIILGVAIILIVTILLHLAQQLLQKQYARSTAALAHELGLTYSVEQQPAEPRVPGNFLLFAQGIPHSRQNIMEGIYKGVDLAVYSYSFVMDLGKVQEMFTQTVIQIRKLKNTIPQFTLFPYDQMDAILVNLLLKESQDRLLESAGIRLPNHPDFRKQYKLIGFEQQKLKALFDNDAVINTIHTIDSRPIQGLFCMEGAGQNLFIYPLYKRIPIRLLTEFMDKGINLAQQIESISME